MDIWLVRISERSFWIEEIQNKTTEIDGIYAFDRSEVTCICSQVKHYDLRFIDTDVTEAESVSDNDKEELYDSIMCNPGTSGYYTQSMIEAIIKNHPERCCHVGEVPVEDDSDSARTDAFDSIQEDWHTGALTFQETN